MYKSIILILVLCLAATAQVPTLISYQGRLTTPSGSPVANGNYQLTFTIYGAPPAGTVFWSSGAQTVAVEGGLFNYYLGSSTPIPDSIFTRYTEVYLGIRVASDPEITPRTRLVSVGYAFKALRADSAGYSIVGGGWTDDGTVVRLTSGTDRVGIGTITPNEQLEITGNLRLPSSTASVGVIRSGDEPFIHNFGTFNTFIGLSAGNLTMGGYNNTACGVNGLNSTTTGSYNTACGAHVLFSNNTGHGNTAIGFTALYSNTTGYDNIASGVYALYSNITGHENTASGFSTLYSNTTGNNNTANGIKALYSNTTGDSSTACGAGALESNTTGYYNTADGAAALNKNTTGICNTAIGMRALQRNTTGNGNTACGMSALQLDTTGYRNTAIGREALYSNIDGDSNSACGAGALYNNTTGGLNTAIGYGADVSSGNLINATAIGALAIVNASNKIRLGNANVTVIEAPVGLTIISDENQKENFRPVSGDEVLRKIRGLSLTSWNYRGHDPQQFRHYGPVAQEFFAAFGHDGVGTSGTPTTINSSDMAGILMIAVQTLEKRTAEVKTIKAENAEMKAENKNLRTELDELKRMVSQLVAQSEQSGLPQYGRK